MLPEQLGHTLHEDLARRRRHGGPAEATSAEAMAVLTRRPETKDRLAARVLDPGDPSIRSSTKEWLSRNGRIAETASMA